MKLINTLSLVLLINFCTIDLPGQAVSNPDTVFYESHELIGNKLFIYTDGPTFSFAPYGENIIRIGLHNDQDTTYPGSLSVIKEPEGEATAEDAGDAVNYYAGEFHVIIWKNPLSYSVINGTDTLLWQGESIITGEGSRMQFHTKPKAAWYGAGSRSIVMNRAGMDLGMLNEPFYGYGWGRDRLNITIPVVTCSEGFALYFENPSPGMLSLGSSEPGLISYEADLGTMSCFVIHSPDPDSLMKPYTELTGRQPLPPLWALGYIQSRFGYENEQEATNVVNQMVAEGFPMDAIVFDLQWQGGVGEMGNLSWDLTRFPDPQAMMEDFLDKGVKSVCIVDPYFTIQSNNYNLLSALGYLAKKQTGDTYVINDFWAGPAGLFDVTRTLAATWFWQRCKNLLENNVKGLWTDLGEPEKAPEDMYFEAGSSQAVRQTFNLQWAKSIYEGFSQDFPDRRLFNLTRSGYAGMQRFSTFPWSGDVQKSIEGMYSQIPIMLGMGLSGFGYMGHDIGGFVGDLNEELYTRWQQMGAFSPVMRAHGTGVVTEPIYFPDPYKSIVKQYIKLRYKLLPYNYTLAYINSTTGMPLVRPLFFEDPSLFEVNDQYLWGNDILVAPVFDEEATYRYLSLPTGKWIDYFNWTSYQGVVNYPFPTPPLDILPIFVRAGALVSMIPEIQYTGQYTCDNYIIKYFADPDKQQSQAMIYMDDGVTQQAIAGDKSSIIYLSADYDGENAAIEMVREGVGFENEPLQKQMTFEIPRTRTAPSSIYYNYVEIPWTDDWEVYQILDDVAFYNPSNVPPQLYVKVQWNSTSSALLEINNLELTTNFSVDDNTIPEVKVYPNPINVESSINIEVNMPGNYQLALHGSLGHRIAQTSLFFKSPGTYSQRFHDWFPVELSYGIYILKIIDENGGSNSFKLVVAR